MHYARLLCRLYFMGNHPPHHGVIRMAQKIQTLFIDDIDGSEAEGTVRFALDGAEYEIDLNAKHAEALRKALARYVDAARRSSGGTTRRPARSGRRAAASGLNTTEVREWARHRVSKSRIAVAYLLNWSSGSGRLRVTSQTCGWSWRLVIGWEAHVFWAPNQGLVTDFPARDFSTFHPAVPFCGRKAIEGHSGYAWAIGFRCISRKAGLLRPAFSLDGQSSGWPG